MKLQTDKLTDRQKSDISNYRNGQTNRWTEWQTEKRDDSLSVFVFERARLYLSFSFLSRASYVFFFLWCRLVLGSLFHLLTLFLPLPSLLTLLFHFLILTFLPLPPGSVFLIPFSFFIRIWTPLLLLVISGLCICFISSKFLHYRKKYKWENFIHELTLKRHHSIHTTSPNHPSPIDHPHLSYHSHPLILMVLSAKDTQPLRFWGHSSWRGHEYWRDSGHPFGALYEEVVSLM